MNNLIKYVTAAGILALLPTSCLNTGCTFKAKDNGEVGFRMANEFVFFSRTSETKAESTVGTDFPSLESWLFSKAKIEETQADNIEQPMDETPAAETGTPAAHTPTP